MDSEFSPVAVIVESKQLTCYSSDMQLFGIFVLDVIIHVQFLVAV